MEDDSEVKWTQDPEGIFAFVVLISFAVIMCLFSAFEFKVIKKLKLEAGKENSITASSVMNEVLLNMFNQPYTHIKQIAYVSTKDEAYYVIDELTANSDYSIAEYSIKTNRTGWQDECEQWYADDEDQYKYRSIDVNTGVTTEWQDAVFEYPLYTIVKDTAERDTYVVNSMIGEKPVYIIYQASDYDSIKYDGKYIIDKETMLPISHEIHIVDTSEYVAYPTLKYQTITYTYPTDDTVLWKYTFDKENNTDDN